MRPGLRAEALRSCQGRQQFCPASPKPSFANTDRTRFLLKGLRLRVDCSYSVHNFWRCFRRAQNSTAGSLRGNNLSPAKVRWTAAMKSR